MNDIKEIKVKVDRIKNYSQELKNEINSIQQRNDISTQFYIGNLKRLSLQALDLFNAMEKQIRFLSNEKSFMPQKRRSHGLPLGR